MEVTDGMLALLREYQIGSYGELDDDCDKRMIAALIELHEANKPKPEPLSEDAIYELAEDFGEFTYGDAQGHKQIGFARAVEQAHGIT